MILSQNTLACLREMINEKTVRRSGPMLVAFFNQYGFRDVYGSGFPSRRAYTEEKLGLLNRTPELDKCIKEIFNPSGFIGRMDVLRACLDEFNEYLAFDGWKVDVKNTGVEIHKTAGPDIEAKLKENKVPTSDVSESDFLRIEIEEIDISQIPIDEVLKPVLETRMTEMKSCFMAKAYLSVIFMAGSMLEGILLSVANQNPILFNQASSSPKDKDGKVRAFYDWRLKDLIGVAHEVGIIKKDVAKFSHVLRDFRNYIHPYQQLSERFAPDENTAKICMQVMKGALSQITNYKSVSNLGY